MQLPLFTTAFLEYDLTLILLIACIILFGYLALRSRNARSFQFQISIFILIWIVGEVANSLAENNLIQLPQSEQALGYEIHVASMVFFGFLLYARYFYSRRRGRELIEGIQGEKKAQ